GVGNFGLAALVPGGLGVIVTAFFRRRHRAQARRARWPTGAGLYPRAPARADRVGDRTATTRARLFGHRAAEPRAGTGCRARQRRARGGNLWLLGNRLPGTARKRPQR